MTDHESTTPPDSASPRGATAAGEQPRLPDPPPGYGDPSEFRYPMGTLVGLVGLLTACSLVGFGWVLYDAQGPGALDAVFTVEETADSVTFTTEVSALALAFVFGVGGVTAVHELVHGLLYRLRGYDVSYGFAPRVGAFYAAAFRQFQTREDNLVAGAAPLVVVDLVLIALLFVPSPTVAFVAFVGLTFNTAGAAGDVYLVATLLRLPTDALLYDHDARHCYVSHPEGAAEDA